MNDLRKNYSEFWAKKTVINLYPTEFVTRIFLGTYPMLSVDFNPRGKKVLDLGFGDGRNIPLLLDLGFQVFGIEVSSEICQKAKSNLSSMNLDVELTIGTNNNIPFAEQYFDVILACNSIYYLDGKIMIKDNFAEVARVLKRGGYLIASLADESSYLFCKSIIEEENSRVITSDPYGIRNGTRLRAFSTEEEISQELGPFFKNISFGHAKNDYFGIDERVYWVVCQKS